MKSQYRNLVLVRVAYNPGYAFKGRYFLRRSLRITAGHQNLCFWILAMDPANGSACILVRGGSYSAGIQDNQIGGGRREGRS